MSYSSNTPKKQSKDELSLITYTINRIKYQYIYFKNFKILSKFANFNMNITYGTGVIGIFNSCPA